MTQSAARHPEGVGSALTGLLRDYEGIKIQGIYRETKKSTLIYLQKCPIQPRHLIK